MAMRLNRLSSSVQLVLLQKGPRTFGLLGKPVPFGLAPFGPEDIGTAWALTAECGCLRLERLSGEEELTGGQLVLPTPMSYNFGILGIPSSQDLVRGVFGLLPVELDQLVCGLRHGNYPLLGISRTEMKCSLTSCLIPPFWPHIVVSNLALFGNVLSLEAFARLLVSSLPQGQLGMRFPVLQPVIRQLIKLMFAQRPGVPYTRELLELAPTVTMAAR